MPMLPVHLPDQNEDGTYEDGLDFSDYSRAHTESHKFFKGRAAPPSWCLDLRKMGELLARYMEGRALMQCPRLDTPEKRVVYAQNRILARMPQRIATLGKVSHEYVELKNAGGDSGRLRVLERQITTLDGSLVVDQSGPVLIVGIIHYFFRCGYSSPETSAALKHMVSPRSVRQIT